MKDATTLDPTGWKPLLLDLFGRQKKTDEQRDQRCSKWPTQSQRRHSTPPLEQQLQAKESLQRTISMSAPLRPPPIPSSIHPMMHHRSHSEEEVSSQSSLMSEVTFMTYSDEKVHMLKEEFCSRMKQQTNELSVDERNALLCEIQREQELTFKWQAEQKKKHWHSTGDMNALRSQNQMDESKRRLPQPDEEIMMETIRIGERRQKQRVQRRGSWALSCSSMATPKHSNSKHNLMKDCKNEKKETKKKQENDNLTEYHDPASKSRWDEDQKSPKQNGESQQATELLPDTDEMHIEQIIELKLLVANQQATIDTLSSKLHNLELANRQQQNRDQSGMKNLETENRNLADQLNQCRASEISLRKEIHEGRNRDLLRDDSELWRELAISQNSIVESQTRTKRSSIRTETTEEDSVANEDTLHILW